MYNLEIEPAELQNTINILKNDNLEISKIIENIILKLIDLDSSKWNSEEKQRMDEVLMPYLKNAKKAIDYDLDEVLIVLQNALNNYLDKNEILRQIANDLPDLG